MREFGFDDFIDRRDVPALKWHQKVLGDDGLDLFPGGVADMDFRVAPCIERALKKRADHAVFGYETVPAGLFPALIRWLEVRHNWLVEEESVLRAPNVLNAIAMAVNAFTDEGAGIVIQPPVFFDFADIIEENNRRVVANPLVLDNGRYRMDFAGLQDLVENPATQMLLLCNPHNPVGRVWSRTELEELGRICRQNDVLVVADEIHGDLVYSGRGYTPFATLGDADALNAITTISPAKSFNIAACCGSFTIVSNGERRALLQAENSRLTVNKNNAFSSAAMEAAYSEGGEWLDAVLSYLSGNLDLIRSELRSLDAVNLIEPEGTFLAWLDFRKLGLAPDELKVFLRKEAGMAITSGASFGEEGEGFGRLNFACPRARLEQALVRLTSSLQGRA